MEIWMTFNKFRLVTFQSFKILWHFWFSMTGETLDCEKKYILAYT